MEEKDIINLANKIYRLTLLFPKKEPLRYKMRETATIIVEHWVARNSLTSNNPGAFIGNNKTKAKEAVFEIEKNLEIIDRYFEIAKWQNWVNYFDVLELQEKYREARTQTKQEIKEMVLGKESASFIAEDKAPAPKKAKEELDQRKQKILKFLKDKERAQVWEACELFPSVSKRTLRRDFHELLSKGYITRIGEKNNTFYQIANRNDG